MPAEYPHGTGTHPWLVVTDSPFNADPTGVADSTAAFQLLVNTLAAANTRQGYVPPGTYRVQGCYMLSRVTLNIDAGVTCIFPAGTLPTDACVFRFHDEPRTSVLYIQGPRLIGLGPWTIDLSAYTPPGGTNPRGVQVLNAKDWEITNLTGNAIRGLAGNTIACGSNQVLTRPMHGRIENIHATGVLEVGSSCIQITGGYDIEGVGLYADGAIPARIETDNNAGDIADNCHFRLLRLTNESTFANACGYFISHANTIKNCSIRDFRNDTGAHGIVCNYSPGGSVSNVRASDGVISGGGNGVQAQVQDLSAFPSFPGSVFERIRVSACTARQAFDIVDGITYRDCDASTGLGNGYGSYGTQGASQTAAPQAASKCILDNCRGMKNAPYGIQAAGVEQIIIRGGVYNDSAARIAVTPGANLVTNTGFETNTTGWSAGTDSVIARITTDHNTGSASLQFYKNTAGDAIARTATGLSGFAVTPGHLYLCSLYAKNTAGTARAVRLNIWWYDSGGVFMSSVAASGNIQTNASTWVLVKGYLTAPVGAAFGVAVASAVATVGSADKHAIDDVVVADYTGAATQEHGLSVDSGTTALLIGADLALNRTARFTGAGTVHEATVATVLS